MMHALGDVYPSEQKIALEARLAALAPWPGARVILGLSGSDAVEAAMKTAVLATRRAGLVAFTGSYHGLSHGPLAACGYAESFRRPFAAQLNPHVIFVDYPARGDAGAIARALAGVRAAIARGILGAVLLEPILGRGGVVEADPDAVGEIARMTHAAGALVIADEIYTGMRRTGDEWLFTTGRWPVPPDVVCLGKALGGTMPISACLMRPEVAAAWGDPTGEAIHTSTFLGNPLACAAAHATLDLLSDAEMLAQLRATADALWRTAFEPLRDDPRAGVVALGGARLLIGLRLRGGSRRALAVMRAMLERGYIVLPGGAGGEWLVLTPPATLTGAQVAHFAETLREVLYRVQS
jgi:4-aminobutyrate aminotransferase/(S)-3-amino-2-methylpropionate transaminase